MRARFFLLLVAGFQSLLPETGRAQHYGAYHQAVNSAEQQLALGHKDSALRWYKTAFRQYDFIFAKDALIAAQIALRTGRPAQADSFLIKGAASGLGLSCLGTISLVSDYVNAPDKADLRSAITDSAARFSARCNRALAAEWESRYAEEQTAKNRYNNQQTFQVYKDIVRRNVAALEKLWNTRRIFPGDRIIGLGNRCEEMGTTRAFYSLAHYDCAPSTLEDLLWGAVEAGMLHPRDFAALWGFEQLRSKNANPHYSTNTGCTRVIKKFNHAWFQDTDSATLAEARKNRARYWLCSVEVDSALSVLEKTEGYKLRFGYR